MGICGSGQALTPEEAEAKKKSSAIDNLNTDAHNTDTAIKKLLLLGAGESGKSTLFKQAIALYGKGYSDAELRDFVPIIVNNVLTSIKTLIKYAGTPDISPTPVSGANMEARRIVDEANLNMPLLSLDVSQSIAALWEDQGIQAAYDNRAKYQLNDSTKYFIERVSDISKDGYLPTSQDVLRSRVRTTGIVETSFLIDENTFKMFDVGGQRNERKKWIHCFENVTAVMFVAAISEYDQQLYEDENTNRMVEAMSLFDEICNSRWFRDTSMILFLNKKDLFADKIKKVPITNCVCFANYQGPNEYNAASEFIKQAFEDSNKSPDTKEVYTHVTCATDTENIKVVFNAVKDIVIRKSLRDGGLL